MSVPHPEQAQRAARRAFGGVEQAKDRHRDARSFVWIDDLRRDVRYAGRTLRAAPGFAAAAILALALGIGANTAIFSLVHAVLLKPMGYSTNADRLVRLMMNLPAPVSPTGRPLRIAVRLTAEQASDVRSRTKTLARVAVAGGMLLNLVGYEDAARLRGMGMSASVFPMLGAQALIGRVFTAADEAAGADPVIVVSYRAWQRYFGGDPAVLHRVLTFDSVLGPRRESKYVVVGVMPPDFTFPAAHTQFWMPFGQATSYAGRPVPEPLLGILRDGVSPAAAAAELGPMVRAIRKDPPAVTYDLVRERDELVAPVKPALQVLAVAVAFLLLIACVNVANLVLARTSARQREIALRVSLGAGRGRLVRQLLAESLLLAFVGGLAGTALAFGGVRLLRWLAAATLSRVDLVGGFAFPRFDEIGIDVPVLLYAVALSVATGAAFGLAPALRGGRSDPMEMLRPAGSGTTGERSRRAGSLQGALVVAQVALATMLLVAGGLLLRSFVALTSVSPGYEPAHVLTFQVSLPADAYPDERLKRFAQDLVGRLRSVPGVQAVGYANQVPTVGLRDTAGGLWRTPDAGRKPSPTAADARLVSAGYLRAMGIRVLRGRGFDARDDAGGPRVLLVNPALARTEFAGEDPIGQRAYVGRDPAPWEIVGVVDDVREFGLDRPPEPQFFVDLQQWPGGPILFPTGAYFVVRTAADPAAVVPVARGLIRQLDSRAALFNVAPMEDLVAASVAPRRLYAILLGLFAAVGLTLAVIGIYSVLSYVVARRTREIGIRMALGAARGRVMRAVLARSLGLTVLGLTLGLAGAAAVGRYLEAMLFGLTPFDPLTFASAAAIFACTAALAAYVPARRAAQVDPLIAIRCE